MGVTFSEVTSNVTPSPATAVKQIIVIFVGDLKFTQIIGAGKVKIASGAVREAEPK